VAKGDLSSLLFFQSHIPSRISKQSTENLEVLLGLLLVITLRKFKIDRDVFLKELLDREMTLQGIPFIE